MNLYTGLEKAYLENTQFSTKKSKLPLYLSYTLDEFARKFFLTFCEMTSIRLDYFTAISKRPDILNQRENADCFLDLQSYTKGLETQLTKMKDQTQDLLHHIFFNCLSLKVKNSKMMTSAESGLKAELSSAKAVRKDQVQILTAKVYKQLEKEIDNVSEDPNSGSGHFSYNVEGGDEPDALKTSGMIKSTSSDRYTLLKSQGKSYFLFLGAHAICIGNNSKIQGKEGKNIAFSALVSSHPGDLLILTQIKEKKLGSKKKN